MRLGKEAHVLLLKDAIEAEPEEVLEDICSGKEVGVREMPLLEKYDDVIIRGAADAIFFRGRRPFLLFEYKFPRKRIPYNTNHVQARLYCYLLHLIGWDTSRLRYALIIVPPWLRNAPELDGIPSLLLRQRLSEKTTVELMGGNASVYVSDFDMKKATSELRWALGFWKEEREAVPTKKPAKCAICEARWRCVSHAESHS